MASEKEENVYRAKLAEQAERYDEMAEYMKLVAETREELSVEERNLLSAAYKNVVRTRRAAWRIVTDVEQNETSKNNAEKVALAASYRTKIQGEAIKFCNEILELLKECVIPSSTSGESKVFYLKMQGDYYRYIANYTQGEAKTAAVENSRAAYNEAMNVVQVDPELQKPTNPIRLGLALNISVFHFEELNNPVEACKIARTAFEDAICDIDNMTEDSYKDSTLLMQLLRDNLTLWTSGDQVEEG